MTNLEKMNELVGSNADKEQIIQWAYMNRILFDCVHLEVEFEKMGNSVVAFIESSGYSESNTEFDLWNKFLDAEFVS